MSKLNVNYEKGDSYMRESGPPDLDCLLSHFIISLPPNINKIIAFSFLSFLKIGFELLMYLIYMIATFQISLGILSCYSLQGTTELVCCRTKIQINSFCINNLTFCIFIS